MKGRNKLHVILVIPLTLVFVGFLNWKIQIFHGEINCLLSIAFAFAIGVLWELYQTRSAFFHGEFDWNDVLRTAIGGAIVGILLWVFPEILTFIIKDGPLFQ